MDESTLNDLLECSVCLERLDTTSKVLPCQHTFCRKCLEVIYASRQELRCPECRILVETKIDDLPPNVLLMRILEGLKSAVALEKSSPQVVLQQQQQQQQQQQRQQSQQQQQLCQQPRSYEKSVPSTERSDGGPEMEKRGGYHRHGAAISLPHGIALFDYDSNENGTLKFKRGDIIHLKRQLDKLWYIGESQQIEGVFPINLIHIKIPLPKAKCVALYDFQMGPNEDEGCLRFTKGTVIQVLRRVDDNWAEGQIGTTIGIFPIEFVELNITAREMLKFSRNQNQQQLRISPKCVRKSLPGLEMPSNQMIPQSNVSLRIKAEEEPDQAHPFNASYRRHSLNNIRSEGLTDESAGGRSSLLPNARSQLNRNSMDTLLDTAASNASHHSSAGVERNCKITGMQHLLPPLPPCLPWVYMALYPYKPRKADELELKKGCFYLVIQRCMDGWFKGVNADDVNGVFPGNYVVPLKANDQRILSNWKAAMSPSLSSMSAGGATYLTNTARSANVPAAKSRSPITPLTTPQTNVEMASNARKIPPQMPEKSTAPRCKSPTTGCLLSSSSNTVTTNSALGPTTAAATINNGLRRLLTHIKPRSKSPNNALEDVQSNAGYLQPPHSIHNNTLNINHSRSGSCPSQLQAFPSKEKTSMTSQNTGGGGLIYRHQRQHSQQQTTEPAPTLADRRSDSTAMKTFADLKRFYRKEESATSVK